jgi:hypothetical protein
VLLKVIVTFKRAQVMGKIAFGFKWVREKTVNKHLLIYSLLFNRAVHMSNYIASRGRMIYEQ